MKSKILFYERQMQIPVKSKIELRYYGELMYIIFDKPYCVMYFTKKRKYWVEVSLKEMMDNLPEAVFLPCKRSVIINVCYLKSLDKKNRMIELEDGSKFKLSKENVLACEEMMSRLTDLAPPCHGCFSCDDEQCDQMILICRHKINRHQNESKKESTNYRSVNDKML